jgi:protein-L-isoaspartate(D-aspartate) O-methyltransferase
MNSSKARFNMVEQQVRPWQVLDTRVLDALSRLPREQFVAPQWQALAYTDTDLPIGHGEMLLAAKIDARLAQDLQLKPTDRVLDVGTGSGFLAALLSDLAQEVVSLEVQAELAEQAKTRLTRLGKSQVKVLPRDACSSLKDLGLFDAVVLGGSVAEVPATLLSLLKPGGRLLAVVGDAPIMRVERHTCVTPGEYAVQSLWDIVAPRLHGFAEHPSFSF